VAVAITVSVAVAYWMGNIASTYTASEKIEMPSSYSVYYENLNGTSSGWKVFIGLKNSGSRDATITNVFLNEKPINDYDGNVTLFEGDDAGTPLDLSKISVSVPKAKEVKLILWLYEDTEGCSSGTTIDIKINSAAGNKYPVLVRLP
jgi:hypothetical protein